MILLNIIGYIVVFFIGIRLGAELDAMMVDKIMNDEIERIKKEIKKLEDAEKED